MASAVIGALRVVLGLDTAQFSAGLATSGSRLNAFASRAAGIAGTIAKVGAAAIAAGAAMATALTVSSMNAIDEQSKLARQLGGSVASLQALTRAADLAGVSQETLAGAMSRLNARLGEAAREGAGEAFEALQRLGLVAEDLTSIGVAERMALLADRMYEAGYSASQMADTLRQLGVRQSEIISLVETGGDAIRAAAGEVERYGVAVTDLQARQIEQANDAWSNVGFTLQGVGNQIATRVAPFVEALVKAFGEAAQQAGGFGDVATAAMDNLFTAAGWVADRLYQIGFFFKALELGVNILQLGIANVLNRFGQLDDDIAVYRHNISRLTAEMDNLYNNGLPSERLDQWVASVRAASEETARAAQMTARFASVFGGPAPVDGLDEFIDGLRTREEVERESYETRLAELGRFLETGQIDEEEAARLRARIEADYNDAISSLRRANADEHQQMLDDRVAAEKIAQQKITDELAKAEADRLALRQESVSAIADIMGSISQIIGREGERAFKIAKAFAIGEALINTATAITKALAGPFPFINAARVAAAGAAQIVAIRRQQPGGGSVTPVGGSGATGGDGSSGGDAGSTPAPSQNVTIHLSGRPTYSEQEVRDLIERLNLVQANGPKIKVY